MGAVGSGRAFQAVEILRPQRKNLSNLRAENVMLCYDMTNKPAATKTKLLPGGRPTLFTLEVGDKLINVMVQGLSLEAAAAKIGIGPRTLFTWQNKHEEFR